MSDVHSSNPVVTERTQGEADIESGSSPPGTPPKKAPEAVEWTPEKLARSSEESTIVESKRTHAASTDLSTTASYVGGETPTASGVSTGAPLLVQEKKPEVQGRMLERPTRMLFFSMLCIFQGYAVMVGPCQQKFKKALHVGQFGSNAELFTQAVDFVHWGCSIPTLLVFTLGVDWIGTVFLSYGLAGMGIGISEVTFLSVITPLGGHTKSWAILAVPVGFGIINIAGMLCTSVGVPVEALYFYVVLWVPIGMYIFHKYAPKEREVTLSVHKQSSLKESFDVWRTWLPMMTPCLVAKLLVNFAMENITPVSFYTFNAAFVPLFDPAGTTSLMKHDIYFAILGVVTLIGNAASQHVAYRMRLERYSSFIALMTLAIIGALTCCYLVTLKIAMVNIAAVFLAFWVNGTVYGGSAIFIDRFIPKEHNLVAYSVWCMIGDLGPILGGAGMDVLRGWICDGHVYAYTCRSSN